MPLNYTRLVWVATEGLKKILSRPFGPLCSTEQYLALLSSKNMFRVVTVGDVVSSLAITNGYRPRVLVVDQKTKRAGFEFDWVKFKPSTTWNPPGTISLESFITFTQVLRKRRSTVLLVKGEEDLLALLAIMILPLGYTLFYGQPNEGVVCVEVDKAKRLEALNIFKQMVLQIYE